MRDIMETAPVSVHATDDREPVAKVMAQYDLLAIRSWTSRTHGRHRHARRRVIDVVVEERPKTPIAWARSVPWRRIISRRISSPSGANALLAGLPVRGGAVHARDVEAGINAARADLPANLPSNPTYRKVNPADAPILILALTSKTMTRGAALRCGEQRAGAAALATERHRKRHHRRLDAPGGACRA